MPPTSGHFGVLRGLLTLPYARAFENAETKTAARKIFAGPFIPQKESEHPVRARLHSEPQNKHDPKQCRAGQDDGSTTGNRQVVGGVQSDDAATG